MAVLDATGQDAHRAITELHLMQLVFCMKQVARCAVFEIMDIAVGLLQAGQVAGFVPLVPRCCL